MLNTRFTREITIVHILHKFKGASINMQTRKGRMGHKSGSCRVEGHFTVTASVIARTTEAGSPAIRCMRDDDDEIDDLTQALS